MKQYKFLQHMPGWSECDPYTVEFDSPEELLNSEQAKQYHTFENFTRFSINRYLDREDLPITIMAEFKNGEEWWVWGYTNCRMANLPIWEPRK